jgi:cytochrome d ubiquinol oxidase subunit II
MASRAKTCWILFLGFTAVTIIVTAISDGTKIETLFLNGFGYLAMASFLIGVLSLPFFLKREAFFLAFLASSLTIVAMFLIVGVTIFPNMVPALETANSLTIYNASSSRLTLTTMLIIALVGMPIVLIYTAFMYRVFRKKVA